MQTSAKEYVLVCNIKLVYSITIRLHSIENRLIIKTVDITMMTPFALQMTLNISKTF